MGTSGLSPGWEVGEHPRRARKSRVTVGGAAREAPASPRCPLRRLSSWAAGCRRPSLFPWLGHQLSLESLGNGRLPHAAAAPTTLPLKQPCSQPGRATTVQMHVLLRAHKSQDPLALVERIPASLISEGRLPSAVTPLSCVCRESRMARIRGAVRWRDRGAALSESS